MQPAFIQESRMRKSAQVVFVRKDLIVSPFKESCASKRGLNAVNNSLVQ